MAGSKSNIQKLFFMQRNLWDQAPCANIWEQHTKHIFAFWVMYIILSTLPSSSDHWKVCVYISLNRQAMPVWILSSYCTELFKILKTTKKVKSFNLTFHFYFFFLHGYLYTSVVNCVFTPFFYLRFLCPVKISRFLIKKAASNPIISWWGKKNKWCLYN